MSLLTKLGSLFQLGDPFLTSEQAYVKACTGRNQSIEDMLKHQKSLWKTRIDTSVFNGEFECLLHYPPIKEEHKQELKSFIQENKYTILYEDSNVLLISFRP